ncbi:MAG: c-type cytochrome, partial [Candidatus Saccharimonas sp.]|nr:c-type cytochrome [Planctomycetaceae bacterium]
DKASLFVVGRDQITRLHDLNHDGEADYYENFNNDAHTTMNGHEYVTCLETDRAGNFYFVKGNCDSQTPHDGSLLRVSADGSKLDVFATGFRNSNGIGMGPNDEITVAPQEGEWTPASGLFVVREGGFYGAMMSHHQATPPTDFIRPLCWFSRRDDNSSGGQLWTTSDRFGPLSNQLLHLSYGQCKLRLVLRESRELRDERQEPEEKDEGVSSGSRLSSLDSRPFNGGSIELPLSFASGIHRGRMNPKDGQLYLTGLKGWVSSAVNDGCFQRVRYVGRESRERSVERQEPEKTDAPVRRGSPDPAETPDRRSPSSPALDPRLSTLDSFPLAMQTYRNGIALTFTRPLQREAAEDPSSYQLEAWNYKWSAAYGSPEYKPSAPGQVGRDEVEPKSATLLEDNRTVFLELPNLKPIDQLAVSYTLLTEDSKALEQTVTLTLNSIPGTVMPERSLHRPKVDAASAALQERLVPGVEIHLPNTTSPMTRRLMAWTWVNVLENTREIRATAYLRIPATGQYRFNAEVDRAATLEINGRTFSLGEKDDVPIRLSRGLTRVTVRHLTTRRSSHFRLLWESDRFPREAVPPHVLFHDPHEGGEAAGQSRSFLQGRALFAEHHCARCHVHWPGTVGGVVPETLAEARRGAPRLDGIGSRLRSDWLAAWLRDPAHLRADATMPRLHETANDAELNDLLAHLESLRDDVPPTDATAATDAADGPPVTAGAVTFERLGCIACHTLSANGAADEWNRVSLHFAKSKFQPGRLVQYLLAPHRHHAGSRMPDFHLSEREAHQLAAYIEDRSSGAVTSLAPNRTGNAERGRTLFAKWRCGHCHAASPTDRLAEPDIRPAFHIPPAHGCLASQPNPKQVAPVFAWSDPERSAIREYVSAVAKGLASKYEPADDMLPRLIASLRCNACHARDEVRSLWPEIVAEEGSGRAMEAVPQLTWVGEKLQGPWIEKLLKGEHKTKPRPWLTARMPSFPAYASVIAHGMAAEHGVPFEEPLPKELDADQIEIGRRLTLRDGGLDCRQCHGVGKEQPRGDASTQIALGINFALARERLRPEFAVRQMLDPPRYDIGSRMPRFAPDLRTTAARHIEGGDARKQFEALKQFLWSVKEE